MKDEHLILIVLGGAAALIAWNGAGEEKVSRRSERVSKRVREMKSRMSSAK